MTHRTTNTIGRLFQRLLLFISPDDGVHVEIATARARLREDLPDRELEAGHDVSAMQNFGFGEGCDIGL